MAAPLAALNAKLPTHAGQLLQDFVDAFDSVQEQLRQGTAQAVVPLTKITLLGTEGVAILKRHLENSTNARFAFSVNASANSVTLMPTGHMPPKPAVTARDLTLPAEQAPKTAGSKVPRPPNAFIIYRKEWHPRVVKENPGVHNNSISVIIGEKWKAEPDHVRAEYKQKAEDAKTQHAINNPGYQYQPRKPSEKKKRMTKNKLAKLAARSEENGNIIGDLAQQPLPDDFDPVSMLDEHLARCANAQPLDVNAFSHIPVQPAPALRETEQAEYATFDSGVDMEDTLRASLDAFNNEFDATHPANAGLLNPYPITNASICAQPTVNGQSVDFNEIQIELPGVGFYNQQSDMLPTDGASWYPPQVNDAAAADATEAFVFNPWCEVERHDRLELEFADWVDMDVYASSPMPDSAAETGEASTAEN
ncbi:hypothetical protein LTR08_004016 [Meristemomyces frigidus]|nr:hypothetical protein LTR08_004016 [Meristemomyces frigidus]